MKNALSAEKRRFFSDAAPGALRVFCVCLPAAVCLSSLLWFSWIRSAPAAETTPPQTEKNERAASPAGKTTGGGEDGAETAGPDAPEDAWAQVWANQSRYVADMETALEGIRKSLPEMSGKISLKLPGIENSVRGLELLAEHYDGNPMLLEAVYKRYRLAQRDLKRLLADAEQARAYLGDLLPRLARFEEAVSGSQSAQDKDSARELAALMSRLNLLKKRLLETQNRLAGALTPGDFLSRRLALAGDNARAGTAQRWLEYYGSPGRFLTPEAWESFDEALDKQWESLRLRLPMELPQSRTAWMNVIPPFLNTFAISALFLVLLRVRLRKRGLGKNYEHMFTNSLPWICLGIAFYGTAWGEREEMYRALLTPGHWALTWGQLALAWDLRRANFPDSPRISPLGGIFPLLALGSLVILLDPPAPLQGVIWLVGLVSALLVKRRRGPTDALPRLEHAVLQTELMMLLLAVFITLFGWARLSILLYLSFVVIVVGIALATGCINALHKLSALIPKEGVGGLAGGLLFGCAFPFVLALVPAGMLQCLISCPGGPALVLPYLRSSVSLGGVSIDVFLILMIFGAFYLTRAVNSAGRAFIRKLPEAGILDPTLMTPLQAGFSYGLWMLFSLLVLRALGVDTDKLAIVAGGFSVGIGFGMQTIVNNLVSGLILIFSRTLREGDVVEVGSLTGTVRKISVRATTVETFDNAVIFVPNSEFISTRLINWTRNSRTVRREIAVGVAYGTDHKLVEQLLLKAAGSNTRVLKYPKPSVFFVGFGGSTLDFSLRFWVNDYNDGLAVSSALRGEILTLFARHKVEVAFPQLDVHLKGESPPRKTPRRSPAGRARGPIRARRKGEGTAP
jgi:small-conductance mechanosensitive channel